MPRSSRRPTPSTSSSDDWASSRGAGLLTLLYIVCSRFQKSSCVWSRAKKLANTSGQLFVGDSKATLEEPT